MSRYFVNGPAEPLSPRQREVLEWAARISPRCEEQLRRLESAEAAARSKAQHDRELLEWLAKISPKHAIELRRVLAAEAAAERAVQSAAEVALREAGWDPAKHPRGAFAQNRGWYSPTGGTGAYAQAANTGTGATAPAAYNVIPVAAGLKQVPGPHGPHWVTDPSASAPAPTRKKTQRSAIPPIGGSGGNGPGKDGNKARVQSNVGGRFSKGSFSSARESLDYHFKKHGAEVGAKDVEQYLRKTEAFAKQLKGASKSKVPGAVESVIRYSKLGKYIDIAADGTIVSFGAL